MKLNLPKQLRAALLSAVVTASAATPSFAAVLPWDIAYDQGQQYATVGGSNVLDININNKLWNTTWSIVFTVDAASLKDVNGHAKSLTLLGVKMTQTRNGTTTTNLAEGATMSNDNGTDKLTLTTWSKGDIKQSITIPESGDITFVLSRNGGGNNNLSLKMYTASSTAPIKTLNSTAAQNFDNSPLAGVVFGGKGSYTSGGSNAFANDADVGSYKIKKAGYSFGFVATDADVRTINSANNILTWNGGASGNWSGASWSKNGTTELQSFTASDSVIFATENATVALDSATSASTAEIRETTTFNLGRNNLTVGNIAIDGGKTLNLEGSGGKLIVDNFTDGAEKTGVGTVHAKNGASIELAGTQLVNTTIEGELILKGDTFVTLGGTVTLDSVKNDLKGGGEYHYSLVGSGVTLKFTGTSDLTKKSNGTTANANSKIGLNAASSITIGAKASLTTSSIYNSVTWTANSNASLTVERNENGDKGELHLSGDSYVKSLNNAGTINSTAAMYSYQNIANTGELTVAGLGIRNKDNTVSSLGGTVTVTGELNLAGGTTNVAGSVKAGRINATGYNSADGTGTTLGGEAKTGDKNNTLEINGATNSAANVRLTGSFGIKKTGSSTQTFSGDTSDYSGAIDVSNGTLNLAQMGDASSVTKIAISGDGTLGLYSGSSTTPSTANESTVTMGNGGSLTVGELGGTLNANLVMNTGSILKMDAALMLGSSLTLNGATLQGGLLNQLLSRSGTVTLFSGVDALTIGASSVDLSADRDFDAAEVTTAFDLNDEVAALFADDPVTGTPAITMNYVAGANGGSITMTSNVPEPATATLSLLALAALAARRRRK